MPEAQQNKFNILIGQEDWKVKLPVSRFMISLPNQPEELYFKASVLTEKEGDTRKGIAEKLTKV